MSRANQGKAWERLLETRHEEYHAARLAVVYRCHPPVKVLSRVTEDGFRAAWSGDGPPDFSGVVAGGRAVVFDAKDCDQARWPLAGLHRHQARDLDRAERAGAHAFVALRLQGVCWVLPWTALAKPWSAWYATVARAAAGTASLGPDDCRALGRAMPYPGDWLGALP